MKESWIDIVLAGALILALVAALLLRPKKASNSEGFEDDEPDLMERLRRFYPDLVRQSGFRMPSAYGTFWAMKILCALVVPLFVMDMVRNAWFSLSVYRLPVILGAVGFFLPDVFLWYVRRARQNQMRRVLSFFVDLVISLLHSGLPLERALTRAAKDGFADANPLADEILILAQEMDLGKERGLAFLELARRTGLREIQGLAGALRIGFEVGAGITSILESQADLLREKRRSRALYRITTSTVIATVPVFLCGVPVYFVIVYFPAILKLADLFTGW